MFLKLNVYVHSMLFLDRYHPFFVVDLLLLLLYQLRIVYFIAIELET